MVLAVVLPLTCIVAAGSALGQGGGGPRRHEVHVLAGRDEHLSRRREQLRPIRSCPATVASTAATRPAAARSSPRRCRCRARRARTSRCRARRSSSGRTAQHSTAFLSFDPQAPSGNKLQISGNITSGAFQGLIVTSQLRFTRVFQGSGAELQPAQPADQGLSSRTAGACSSSRRTSRPRPRPRSAADHRLRRRPFRSPTRDRAGHERRSSWSSTTGRPVVVCTAAAARS